MVGSYRPKADIGISRERSFNQTTAGRPAFLLYLARRSGRISIGERFI